MRPTDKATADSRSVQSFGIIKNTEHGNFVMAVFTLELEMDSPSEISLCIAAPSLQTPLLRFFLRGGGVVERLSGTDNPVLKLSVEIDVRRIAHSKLKLFHFQIKKYYLSDANHQTDNPSHTNTPSLV